MKINFKDDIFTLYKEKEAIGHCRMVENALSELFIQPQWRGKGYGSYLLKEVLRASGGYDRQRPSCHTAPLPADSGELAFWEKFDFIPAGGKLVRDRRPDFSAVQLSHVMLQSLCPHPQLAIDATCGNGHDTLFLCGLAERVIGLDIQPQAVENTNARLAAAGYQNGKAILENHANLAALAEPGTVDCIMFNFGWLPGADHDTYSTGETSIPALESALTLLKRGGVLSAVLYSGKVIGDREKQAILAWLRALPLTGYTVIVCDYANYADTAPLPCFVVKK